MTGNHEHVLPREDKWIVKREGAERASKVFERKGDAIEYAKHVAENQKVCAVIHDSDGKIQKFDCYPKEKNLLEEIRVSFDV